MAYEIDPDYVDVAERIREFREKHPNGSLQQHDLKMCEFGGKSWVVFTAAAYRTPDDERPGHGTAWEQVPGTTPFTRGSELQNSETSAWGRAIVAALAADTKKIATAEDIQNRRAEDERQPPGYAQDAIQALTEAKTKAWNASKKVEPGLDDEQRKQWIYGEIAERGLDGNNPNDLTRLAQELLAQDPWAEKDPS